MLLVKLNFLAGRFHATPWGRHVNEGVPEWPPSPYRLVRTLYDTWCRKRPDWPADRVEPLLEALASAAPLFRLPPAAASHTRAFLSTNQKDETARQLIFDAFAALDPSDSVLMAWPDVRLDERRTEDLDELLSLVNYMGRSESWVSASIVRETMAVVWNCRPEARQLSFVDAELVPVACPEAAEQYGRQPYVPTNPGRLPRSTSSDKTQDEPLPWLSALAWSTGEWLASRRNEPPAFRSVTYARSRRCFEVNPRPKKRRRRVVNGVLYALESKVMPSVVSTLELAERVRRKLMGIHKGIVGDPSKVSCQFSGKNASGRPLTGHQHVYILPLDRDQDGRLDHLLVACKQPLDHKEQIALDRLQSLWQTDRKPDIRCTPIRWGTLDDLFEPARCFTSATPFVPPRYYRQGRGEYGDWLAQELAREAEYHGLPRPARVTPVSRLVCRSNRTIRWIEFRRNRKEDPNRIGFGFELEFHNPVTGPIVLGYGCHFGLGQFVPKD